MLSDEFCVIELEVSEFKEQGRRLTFMFDVLIFHYLWVQPKFHLFMVMFLNISINKRSEIVFEYENQNQKRLLILFILR